MTWYLVPTIDDEGGVNLMLLEAIGVSKIGTDDVVPV